MRKTFSARVLLEKTTLTLAAVLFCATALKPQPVAPQGNAPEQRTARYFESIRKSPPQELAFLLKLPKGGDLHNHLSGSIYAETYIQWAADKGLCIDTRTMILFSTSPPTQCDPKSEK